MGDSVSYLYITVLRESYLGQGLARVEERGHPVTPGAVVHRHILDRINAINDSLKIKKNGVLSTRINRGIIAATREIIFSR